MNELIIFDGTDAIAPTGNARLDELNGKIAETMRPMGDVFKAAQEAKEAFYKASAPFFGEVKRDKLFEKGGFKSFDEYALETFGIKKSMAYMIANVGIQFFLEDNDYTRKARETFTVSNLAELLKADRVAIADSIDKGELDSTTAQEDLRKFEDAHLTHKEAAKRKEKVVPTFDLYAVHPSISGGKAKAAESVVKDEFKAAALSYCGMESGELVSVKFEGDKASAAQHFVIVAPTGVSFMFEYRPHVTAKAAKKGKREDFDLAAYIASLSPEERDALAAMVKGD